MENPLRGTSSSTVIKSTIMAYAFIFKCERQKDLIS